MKDKEQVKTDLFNYDNYLNKMRQEHPETIPDSFLKMYGYELVGNVKNGEISTKAFL